MQDVISIYELNFKLDAISRKKKKKKKVCQSQSHLNFPKRMHKPWIDLTASNISMMLLKPVGEGLS